MPTAIRHEPENARFVAPIEGAEAVLEYRMTDEGTREYYRTYVPPELRGRGIATEIVEFALEDARAAGVRVIPSCPFVARIASADARFADVVVH